MRMPGRTAPSKRRHSGPTPTTNTRLAPNPITERKRAAKNAKPLKAIFKGKSISSVGHFENCGKILGAEDITNYVTAHGGTYEREVSNGTTHLICSIEEYKKRNAQVQRAWALGKGRCSIVVFDWIVDCTTRKSKSCRAATGYTLDRTIKRMQNGKTNDISFREKFEDGVRASKELVDNRLWHIYYDREAFEYKVLLTRINFGTQTGKSLIEKYTLYLFESHAFPHLYMCGAKLSRSNRPCTYYREACHAMEFRDAFKHFQHFFKTKTGVAWDDRLEKRIPTPIGANAVLPGTGQLVERNFIYAPPVRGRPVGLLPAGYIRPEDRVVPVETGDSTNSSSGSSSEEGSGSGSGSGSEGKSNEDVVYDTDSDIDSDDGEEDHRFGPYANQGSFGSINTEEADLRLAQDLADELDVELTPPPRVAQVIDLTEE
ncbi:uncharacterized protein LY89DRAFT_111738 [Mollisia scopiformis]|uniref:BRCT domain-containing protein n=1 Tax=Mollisia scopiformis TaxID=149040 RepID=A0A194X6F7_MOLSC|nr:uncharacterized protein LY89DRAFT_111738 [Mollisia scopiformis]KUJ15392.1 hypothetical protein LY89DRAFT_111738 [Mollisia scopiformis]